MLETNMILNYQFKKLADKKQPTKVDLVTKTVERAMSTFDYFEIDGEYSYDGTLQNVQLWSTQKQGLRELFQKHPGWDEDKQAIIFEREEERLTDATEACNHFVSLIRMVAHLGNYLDKNFVNIQGNYRVILDVYRSMLTIGDSTLTKQCIDFLKSNLSQCYIDQIPAGCMNEGTKITRIVNKLFKNMKISCRDTDPETGELGDLYTKVIDATKLEQPHEPNDRNYTSYQKTYAKFSDALSVLKVKKTYVISINFCDFLSMSHGNSWASCHYINSNNLYHEGTNVSYEGCYKLGTLSYALDECSFIFYTVDEIDDDNYDLWLQPKLNRMCCQYQNQVLITGKLYPDNADSKITEYRQLLQYVLSTLEGYTNKWTFSKRIDRIDSFVKTARNSGHYADYLYEGQKPTISIHSPYMVDDIEDNNKIIIGHEAYCVYCGCTINASDSAAYLQCEDHKYSPCVCRHCGCSIKDPWSSNVLEYNDDEYYCPDCNYYCDYCDCLHPIWEDHTWVESANNYVCDYYLYRNYAQCDECGEWEKQDDLVITGEDKQVCEYCIYHDYNQCDECGEYYPIEQVTITDNGHKICDKCKKEEK